MPSKYTIDTNFFIAGFSESPPDFKNLHQILRKHRIQVLVTDYVNKEMRWYMRRIIEPLIVVKEVKEKPLKDYCSKAAQEVNMALPQLPDMSVVYLAQKEGVPIVSSDWRLVEVAQKLGIEAMMNSAFLVKLQEEIEDDQDLKYLQKLHQKLFADEISYSVKSQGRYDPVVRIQKIMDSALDVVRKQSATLNESAKIEIMKPEHNFPEYRELMQVTKEIRTDISDYIELMEVGDYKRLKFELSEGIQRLVDLSTEVRMQEVEENDLVYMQALTTLAHILLLASTVALDEQRLQDAISIVDQLLLVMLENKEVEERLDIEVHLQRMTIFFLTEQLQRLRIYFSPPFIDLCSKRNREDIINLHRTMGIIAAVLTNNEIEKTATAKDFSEIQYVIQLGVQFISVDKNDKAWLLLEQAIYMSLNSNMTGLLYAVFEVMLPFTYFDYNKYYEEFHKILKEVKKHVENLPYDDYVHRSKRNSEISEGLIKKRFVLLKSIPTQFQGFLDVLSAETVDFKNIGRTTFVRVIDWHTMHVIGIIDPSLSLEDNLSIGASVKLHSGKFRVITPSKTISKSRDVDLVIIGKGTDVQYVIRRAGQITLAQSRVGEYDL